jgi:hypothetical protein
MAVHLNRKTLYPIHLKETHMPYKYKTIVLELLEQQTELHERLRITRRLLPTLEAWAKELKVSHEAWEETLLQTKPGSDPIQISSEALEIALKELEDRMPSASPPDENETLDQAMAHVRSHPPRV